ncbi:hypothetical protein LEP1GSC106_1140 [Leptospira interrogans serovar Grippotyphosa str. UI 12764]|nr:hypothetical protein LEP1GSC106_1140 [Leptospira interrogans serovar Grippotyphosa str. UI 12764]
MKSYPKPSIRPKVLQKYHETTYGGLPLSAEAIADATFEEYYALYRLEYPKVSRWRAAMSDFRSLTSQFKPDMKSPLQMLDWPQLIRGWEGLRRLECLTHLSFTLCGTNDNFSISPLVSVDELRIVSGTSNLLKVLLQSVQAKNIYIDHENSATVDLSLLKEPTQLESLTIFCGIVRGLAAIQDAPIRELYVSNIHIDEKFGELLSARANTLESLTILNARPFGPDFLKPLRSLKRFTIPGDLEYRDVWIRFAVENPFIGCRFIRRESVSSKTKHVKPEEIYRGIDILQITTLEKTYFQIASNVADEILDQESLDNEIIEDKLKLAARRNRKRIRWSSELDALVAQTEDLNTCRWIIDQVFLMKDSIL